MKSKNILLKLLPVAVAASLLLAGILYTDMNGNPFDAAKINKMADAYMQEKYPDIWQNVYRSADAYFVKSDISYFEFKDYPMG